MQKDGLKTIDDDNEKKIKILESKRYTLDILIKKLKDQNNEKLTQEELDSINFEIKKYNNVK